ncbi:MAG: hypothetical protein LBV43_09200 [Prevotella sp.]|jgi:tetratricopeptide (TPR) repeat protein|nr:hypothetical protein [Prevotella sp.]
MKTQKGLLLFILFTLIYSGKLYSQIPIVDNPKYTKYYDVVDKWIMVSRTVADTVSETSFNCGFIFIDPDKGFFLQIDGQFDIDNNGNYIMGKPMDISEKFKYPIGHNWAHVDTISQDKRKELDLPEHPSWLKFYKKDENEPSYKLKIATVYNRVGAYKKSLPILTSLYDADPNMDGLAVELSHLYKAAREYDKIITLMESAMKVNPENPAYYSALGHALLKTGKPDEAESFYRKGIELSDDKGLKGSMAFDMVTVYFDKKDKEKFNEWYAIAKASFEKDSLYDKILEDFKSRIN